MMKLAAIIMALLFVGVVVPVNAKVTDQDMAWVKAMSPGMKLVIDDAKVLAAVAATDNASMIQIACNTTKEDIISAETVNQAMPVSKDVQPLKDDYTLLISSMWTGVNDVGEGYATGNQTKVNLGGREIIASSVYATKMNRDIDIAKAA